MDADALLRNQRFLRRLARELGLDPHAAEDVAQAAWLAALEHPPRPGSALRAWLARVARNLALNRRRSERSEAARRELVAEERCWPGPAELAQRLELQERVLAALRELPVPLQAVVQARYHDELPLEEIARRTGVSHDAVKERLKRARELLRRRLGRELDEEGGLAALVALGTRGMERIGGGVLVKKVVALVAVLLVGLVVWARWREPQVSSSTPATMAVAAEVVLAPARAAAPAAPAQRVEPTAPESLAATTSGSLLVSVTWPDGAWPDGGGAEGVTAYAWADEERELARFFRVATTGSDGLARIDGLAGGIYRVQLDREKEFARAEVRAGEETRVELVVSAGPRVEGLVVDAHGQPVAGAGIWVRRRSPLLEGLAALSGADGRFTIPSMGSAIQLGARAEGYAPSNDKTVQPSGRPFEEVRLVLPELGGSLAGRVLDADGTPVANAVVSADVGFRFEGSRTGSMRILNSLQLAVLSAADGSFRLGGVQPGGLELVACAPDRMRFEQEVQVTASATTWVEVVLEPGESVSGRILAPGGGPLGGVLVFAPTKPRDGPVMEDAAWLSQDWKWFLERDAYASTRSASDGSYRLSGLRPGWTYVAADAGEAGRELESVLLESGSDAYVDLVVSRGLELHCRLVNASGEPLAGLPVSVGRMGGSGGTMGSRGGFRTDAEGRFSVPNCQEALYSLGIRHARYDRRIPSPEASAVGLRPGPGEHTLVVDYPDLAPAFVRGFVVDDHGTPLANAVVGCRNELEGFGGGGARSDASGEFLTSELEPGRYRIGLSAEGFPRSSLGPFDLAEGQTLDLGTVRMKAAGFLSVRLRREDGGPVDDLFDVSLDTATQRRVTSELEIELGVARFLPLEPGDYVLHVEGQSCLDPRLPVRIEAGATAELELVLRIGGWRDLRFPGREDATEISHLHVVVRDSAGGIVFEDSVEETGDGFLTGHAFERGSYTLEAICDDGRRASGAFEVLGRDSLDAPLDFELR